MYERFTDRARNVMHLANKQALRLHHEYIGTEHILLGLIKEGAGVASVIFRNLDIDSETVRLEVEKILVAGGLGPRKWRKLPQTPRANKVIEYALEEARRLNINYVGTEHVLLGLLREKDGVAGQVLAKFGLTTDNVREHFLNMLLWTEIPERDARIATEPAPIRLVDRFGRWVATLFPAPRPPE